MAQLYPARRRRRYRACSRFWRGLFCLSWFDSAPGHQHSCAPAPVSGSGAFLQFNANFYKIPLWLLVGFGAISRAPWLDSDRRERSGSEPPPRCRHHSTQALRLAASAELPPEGWSSSWRASCRASAPGHCGTQCNASSTTTPPVSRHELAVPGRQPDLLTRRTARRVAISKACLPP